MQKKILFLFAHLHKGGMQRAVSNISLALPNNITQYVGFFGVEEECFNYNAKLINFSLTGSLETGFINKVHNFNKRIAKLRSFVKNENINTVVSFGDAANLINVLSFHNAECITSIRGAIGGYEQNNIYSKLYKRLALLIYRFPDKIVTVSDELKVEMSKISDKNKITHIPNLYHLDDIIEKANIDLPLTYSNLNSSRFLLCVGSLTTTKGQEILINAFKIINCKYPDLRLVLIGRGPKKPDLIELAEKLNVLSHIDFINFDPNPYRYMKRANLFVLPSLTEGFPNVLVEAMACGCPTVAFDCKTGPKEIIGQSEFGEIINEFSSEKLAEKIVMLLNDKIRYEKLKELSIRRASDFSSDRVISQWIKILSI